ncbi:hypothetical protein [Maribacter sp. 2307ULW6-5]|uniref:hypothetical protein n=1 Tax=Maribacter sp. 2307ULW6-5 TaxID=3386275 RepID=UPI0039BD1758
MMLNDIDTLHHNALGIAFLWKGQQTAERPKIQLVFRDTGLLLTKKELCTFYTEIEKTKGHGLPRPSCPQQMDCRALLLETPMGQLTFAVSPNELQLLGELVEGALFQLRLNGFLDEVLES